MNTIDLNQSFVILDTRSTEYRLRSGIQFQIKFFLDPRLRPRGRVEDDNVLVLC
jgi:hypothetical protein